MFNKINTKWLGTLFAILLLVVVLIMFIDKKSATNRNRTFNSQLTDYDTAQVTSLTIYPKQKAEVIELLKEDDVWKIIIEDKKYKADINSVKGMLSTINDLKASRIAATKKDYWAEFDATDSAATRVVVKSGKKILSELYIGKFSYQQPKNANPYMQQQGKMTTYVRLEGDKKVYAVEGFLSMSFSRQSDDFRNHAVIRAAKESLNKLTFTKPEGSFSLVKQGNQWMVNGMVADSALVDNYLNTIKRLNSSDFIDGSNINETDPVYTLSIEGDNLTAPIKVKAFIADTANFYAISSSLNEGTYFSGKKSGLMDKIFIEKNSIFEAEGNKK